ncbi:nuclear transport factor 2 family protein [Jiangella ureilytica]|uniref:Nuclear transport factor 2 family protein n=1 Tax=Jiangella ureilytica TaxID=2530374 RepID=A0A4R4RZ03_9ACTN|nr:nuclear transport factor 2 family protein [Jiangella ureilytica]TDC53963.1 nuclear transport factor 2 family protein [Jiangella ureilytica]
MTDPAQWSQEQINTGLALRAWSYYYIHSSIRDTTTCYQPLIDLCAEDIIWSHDGPRDERVPTYPGVIHGKQALADMLSWEDDIVGELDLLDPIERPIEFIAEGNQVVALIAENYRIKRTGAVVRNDLAVVVMDFEDHLITRMRIIANLADYIETHLGVGWSVRA